MSCSRKARNDVSPLSVMSRITGFLYLGSARAARNEELLKENGITHVINATIEADHEYEIPVECTRIKIYDNQDCQIGLYFDTVADKIEEVKNKKGKVFIHCVAGISRSSTLVMAYLMKYKKMNLKNAFQLVKKKRPIISPGSNFWQDLIDYERKLFDKTTVSSKERNCGAVAVLQQKSVKDLFDCFG